MKNRVVVLGGDTPLGREVRERLEALVPDVSVRLIGGVPEAVALKGAEPVVNATWLAGGVGNVTGSVRSIRLRASKPLFVSRK